MMETTITSNIVANAEGGYTVFIRNDGETQVAEWFETEAEALDRAPDVLGTYLVSIGYVLDDVTE